jgi:hypothetical protein
MPIPHKEGHLWRHDTWRDYQVQRQIISGRGVKGQHLNGNEIFLHNRTLCKIQGYSK